MPARICSWVRARFHTRTSSSWPWKSAFSFQFDRPRKLSLVLPVPAKLPSYSFWAASSPLR